MTTAQEQRLEIPQCCLRTDTRKIVETARERFGVKFAPGDLPMLEWLADRWSTDSILIALSLAVDEYGAERAVERFTGQAQRALQFLAETTLEWSDPLLLYVWQCRRRGVSEYRALHDLDVWCEFAVLTAENANAVN